MLHEDFAEALVHQRTPHRVCGLRLRPFSRWHAANLDFVGSPFAGNRREQSEVLQNLAARTFAELWLAALCCRLSYPETVSPGDARLRRALAAHRHRRDPVGPLNAFHDYLSDYNTKPEFGSVADAPPIKTPWYLYEVCLLLKLDPHLTKAQAWDLPIGEGGWWIAGYTEASGAKIEIITAQDLADFKKRAERTAATA